MAATAIHGAGIRRTKARKKTIHRLLVVLSVVLGLAMAFPLYWLLRGSFVSHAEILARPPVFFPSAFGIDNFSRAIDRIDFSRQLWNSVSIVVPYVVFNVITTSFAGYAFAKLRFPLRGMWFALVISTMMLPSAVTLIPQYSLFTSLGLAGKPALIIPAIFCAGGMPISSFCCGNFS